MPVKRIHLMNREYIKEWVWEERKVKPGDQTYFFAKMARKERQYMAQEVDLIVTDSPLILTHFYGNKYDKYEQEFNTSLAMLKQQHAITKGYGYHVDHYFIERGDRNYDEAGRNESFAEAVEIDNEIKQMLEEENIKYRSFNHADVVDEIVGTLLEGEML